jgi:hypothetical protein
MLSNNSIINELPLGKNNPKVIWNTFSIKNLFKLKTNFFSLVSLMGILIIILYFLVVGIYLSFPTY